MGQVDNSMGGDFVKSIFDFTLERRLASGHVALSLEAIYIATYAAAALRIRMASIHQVPRGAKR